jgi:hypothetical protein
MDENFRATLSVYNDDVTSEMREFLNMNELYYIGKSQLLHPGHNENTLPYRYIHN